ncbi:MAG: glycosyltransferase, partial [Alphaproteobacteria bacterium]|nr:glycosyltransferase [Alphaproteobacteria bacterium]
DERDLSETINGVQVHRRRSPNQPWNFVENRNRMQKLLWHARENVNFTAMQMANDAILQIKPNIVVTSTIENFGGSVWAAAAKANVKCINVLRSYFAICWRGSMFRRGVNRNRCCLQCVATSVGRRYLSRHVDGIVGVSKYILQRHVDEGLFTTALPAVLPEPVPESYFSAGRTTRSPQTRFGFLGALTPNKGVELLAEGWREFRSAEATLAIAGAGAETYVADLRARMPADVVFLGWVDPVEFLREIDFLVVPSVWREPFGRIVVEAFAAGVPVIGSDTGGIAELVKDEVNGFVFSNGSPGSLLVALQRAEALTLAQYQKMSENSVECARRYRMNNVADEYLAYFAAVIDGFTT